MQLGLLTIKIFNSKTAIQKTTINSNQGFTFAAAGDGADEDEKHKLEDE